MLPLRPKPQHPVQMPPLVLLDRKMGLIEFNFHQGSFWASQNLLFRFAITAVTTKPRLRTGVLLDSPMLVRFGRLPSSVV